MIGADELAAAATFLAPVVSRDPIFKVRGQSVIERLAQNSVSIQTNATDARAAVIRNALAHLLDIHHTLVANSNPGASQEVLYTSNTRRTIDGLLDLISLEGIYPNLSPGVGIPIERRVASVLKDGIVTRPAVEGISVENEDKSMLIEIVGKLGEIGESKVKGLWPALQERVLVDLIAAFCQLAFAPQGVQRGSEDYASYLKRLLDETPSQVLYPILTSLLQPACPTWLRPHLSAALSLLPLRPDGVRHAINFIASTAPQAPLTQDDNGQNQSILASGPALSLEVLAHASKVLSSVPSARSPEDYFSTIAPQLLELLDKEGSDMQRAAAYIIGTGILGRRIHGAPGTIGWKLFVVPILEVLDPDFNSMSNKNSQGAINNSQNIEHTIASGKEVSRALHRLSALLLIHPNPGLTKRLIHPLLLPLWGLLCVTEDPKITVDVHYKKPFQLLSTHFKLSASTGDIFRLADHLLWDGGSTWTYQKDYGESIQLCQRSGGFGRSTEMAGLINTIALRVEIFLSLLKPDIIDEQEISSIFLHVSERWLLGHSGHQTNPHLLAGDESSEDPLLALVYAKITEDMLGRFKDQIAAHPDQIIQLVQQLLDSFIKQNAEAAKQQAISSEPSFMGLSSITTNTPQRDANSGADDTTEDLIELVSIALSLLSAILSSPEFIPNSKTSSLLMLLQPTLSQLTSSRSCLPSSATMTASNISALIDLRTSLPSNLSKPTKKTADPQAADRRTHALALTYLTEPLPPVRAEGLSLLTSLIRSSSPILDIPSTSILLLSLLQDNEEFIYLPAIKSLGLLASRHSRTVVRMLVDRYTDREEDMGLDQRLRVGEALLKTIEGLGGALVGEAARTVGNGMIDMAGRRGRRIKNLEEKRQSILRDERKKREAEQAWGGEVPKLDDDEPTDEVNERLSKVLEGWEGKEGEEDVRIRTSALSVLGIAIETNIAGIGSTIVSTAVDIAVSILKVEVHQEKAILRRAAVLVIMSLIKALYKADEQGQTLGFGLAGENLGEIIQVLKYIQATDSDEVVVGHVREVIESLETWQSKSLFGISSSGLDRTAPNFGLEGTQLAGLSVNPNTTKASRPRIEEIE